MTVAQTRSARRRIIAKYHKGGTRSVSDIIASERIKAQRMAAAMSKKKK